MKRGKSNFSASMLFVSGQDGRFWKTSAFPKIRSSIDNEPIFKPVNFLVKSVFIIMEVGVGLSGLSKDIG